MDQESFFKGVVDNSTILSDNLTNIEITFTKNSIPIHRIQFPPRLRRLVVWTTEIECGIDRCKLPESLRHFEIKGENNSSLEKLVIPQGLKTLTVDRNFKQPVDLLNFKVTYSSSPVTIKVSDHDIFVSRLSLYNTWFNEMHEGRSPVNKLILEGPKSLRKGDRVFFRSLFLQRPVCKNLDVQNEILDESVLLSFCESLSHIKYITVRISFLDVFPISLLPRLANILSGSRFLRKEGDMYIARSFGGTMSTVSSSFNVLTIVMGNLPRVFKPKYEPESSIEMISPVQHKPSIILHTWSACSYCKRQEDIIEEFKTLGNNADRFTRHVEVRKIDDPEKISDSRVTSFPSWVVSDVITPGVKNAASIEKLLEKYEDA